MLAPAVAIRRRAHPDLDCVFCRRDEMAISLESIADADVAETYGDAFPNSRKVHVSGTRGIRVPFRGIRLSGGDPPLPVYATSVPRPPELQRGRRDRRAAWSPQS